MPIFEQFVENNVFLVCAALVFLTVILLIWVLVIHIKIRKIQKRNEEFYAGGKIPNLEELLVTQAKNIKILDKDIQELFNISNQINKLALKGLHKIGMIRFNPFKDVGGDQSFAIALLNGKNNGITISSLYTREGTRIYSKSIIGGKSEKYPLTKEEEEAIRKAMEPEIKK